MPILLVLILAAACLPVPWPEPPAGLGPRGSLALTVVVTLAPVLAAAVVSAWVVRTLRREPDRRSALLGRYARTRWALGLVNLALAAVAVVGLGWGWTVRHELRIGLGGRTDLAPGAELLVPAPYFLSLVLCWAAYFPAERAFHRASGRSGAFWSLPGYVFFHARQFALLVGVPVGACVAQQGLARAAPELVRTDWFQAAALAAGVALFVVLPRVVKPALGLQPLPPGPVRDRLEATARRLGLRYTDLLVWPTRGAMANAMVVGVVPWARYVIFTDRLLDGLAPDELDAVFGHEAGHVRHGHIPYYAGFLLLSAVAATAALALLWQAAGEYLGEAGRQVVAAWEGWLALPTLLMMGAYIFVVFGLLSRRCERQADVFGCRTGSCPDPGCMGHDEKTPRVPAGRGLCRTGTLALVRALDRVAVLNGMDGLSTRPASRGLARRLWAVLRAWQHGPVVDRIEFLLRLSDDPSLGDRVDRRVRRFRWVLLAGLTAAVVALGSAVGWAELWKLL